MYYSVQREVDRLLDDSLREVALSFDNIRSQDQRNRCLVQTDGIPAGNGPSGLF